MKKIYEKKLLKSEETPHEYRIKIEQPEMDLIRKYPIKKILEVCSGDGKNVLAFAKRGYDIYGIESEDKYIQQSLQLLKKSGLHVSIIQHPIYRKRFPFRNEKFDFIYSYQYLNHNFKDEIEKVFVEIFRVLKKKRLFSLKITDIEQFDLRWVEGAIYKECDPEFPKIKYYKLAKQTFAKLEGDEKWIPHYGFYKDELINSLQKTGFKIINIRKIRWNLVVNCTK